MLMTLLKDEEEMNKFNFEVIDKIIHIYGPMVDGESKWQTKQLKKKLETYII